METVLLTGGTGAVGTTLVQMLHEAGYAVIVLSRGDTTIPNAEVVPWNAEGDVPATAMAKASYIIHLAGAPIMDKKWTAERKQEILNSRVKMGERLYASAKQNNATLKAYITASAVGIYGAETTGEVYYESSLPASDFLGEVSSKWEAVADKFQAMGVRTVKIRSGIVLSEGGGVVAQLLPLFKLGLGSAIGSGNQPFPWIHVKDLCGIFLNGLQDPKMAGAYNAVAPTHSTNKEFSKTMAVVLKKPFWFPNIPAGIMRLILGSRAILVLAGNRVSARKIVAAGYQFRYSDLAAALQNLLVKP